MVALVLSLLTASGVLGVANASPIKIDNRGLQKRWPECWGYNPGGCPYGAVGSHGAAVSEVGTCSAVGVDTLKAGGNAADAMIAQALCVGVVGGFHSGIGGGGFMLIRFNNEDGSHGYEQIDFRETMPAAGNETMYSQYGVNQTKSTIGGLAVGVPGELRGWEMLHNRHGSMPWKDLFQPAIKLARDGFPVNEDLASFLTDRPFIVNSTYWKDIYSRDGAPLVAGDMVYHPALGDTLERIANEGADVFYRDSEIADNIVKAAQETGGIITLEDLAGYKAILRNASTISYRGKRIYSTTAPSSGTVVLSTLKIFEGFDGSASDDDPAIDLTTHRLVEANKLAYGQRSWLGDPDFTANVSTLEASFLTDEVVAAARAKIVDDQTSPVTYYNPSNYYPTAEGGTSHMAVVDCNGMAISLTSTVNLIWGSQVMTANGIVLNNEMDDFSQPGLVNAFGFAANPLNFVQPGKRPQSSIASSLVEDENGDIIMLTGSAGGSRIITTTMQEIYHYVDQGMNASQCTGHSRWHDQLSGVTFFEWPNEEHGIAGYPNSTVDYFRNMGYNITYQNPLAGSTSHAIGRLEGGDWLAAADPRKAAGYGQAY